MALILTALAAGCSSLAGCASLLPTPSTTPASSAQVGDNTIVIAAQGPPRQTLPQFLGSRQFLEAVGLIVDRVRNRLGTRFPGLEARPPLLAITDPANAESSIPSVAAAAAAKAEEDAAPQKIKAIRYLARLGCKECYPDTIPALLAALDDCTESVRYEAARALRMLTDGPCKDCKNGTCCTAEVVEKLDEVVNGRTETGLPAEQSERVRRMARLALENCNCAAIPGSSTPDEVEGPLPGDAAPAAEGPAATSAGSPTPAAPATALSSATESFDREPPRRAYDVVVARVNDQPIYRREIDDRVEQRLRELRQQASHRAEWESSLLPQLFDEQLEAAIDRTLLVQAARGTPPFVERISFRSLPPVSPNTSALDGFSGTPVTFNESGTGDSPTGTPPASPSSGASLASLVMSDDELAEAWLERQLPIDEHVSADEIRGYYHQHREQFRRSAEIRWERVSATNEQIARQFGSRDAARAVLQELRERAESLTTAAPPSPELQSLLVSSFDWTTYSAIASNELAEALRRLPIGRVSPIVEDPTGLYVARVLARRPERLLSLEEAAPAIRGHILEQRMAEPRQRYLAELRRRGDVWTIR